MDTRSSRSTGSSKSRGDDLDEDRGSSSRSRDDDRRSSSKYDSREEDEGATGMGLSARLGTARMGTLGFVTWGGELDVPVATALHLVAGVEGYSTKRDFTEDERAFIAEEQGIAPEQVPAWNTILPLNAGIAWRPGNGTVRPYLGADLTITPYTANFDIAVGARARGGLDVMVARNFGFNLNVAAGVVSGSKLAETQEGFQNTNLVPQFSAGTVARF
jgi:hypothetical protein